MCDDSEARECDRRMNGNGGMYFGVKGAATLRLMEKKWHSWTTRVRIWAGEMWVGVLEDA